MRLGVRLTAFKARLFDLVRRGGTDGISSSQTLKAHVWQINEMIADEGYRIDGRGSSYRLVNMRKQVMSRIQSISSVV